MVGVTRFIAAVAQVLLIQVVAWPAPILATEASKPNKPAERTSASGSGRLVGVVTDTAGAPVEALVSATGPAGVALAVCDADGRFEFRALRPGTYLLRTHVAGLDADRRSVVEVKPGLATNHSVTLKRRVTASSSPTFLAAGFGSFGGPFEASDEFVAGNQPDDVLPDLGVTETPITTDNSTPHDDSEKAWRLRRARRSVLKDSGVDLVRAGKEDGGSLTALAPRLAADRTLSNPPSTFPVSGQLHLLTRARVDSSNGLRSRDILPGQIAYASVGGAEHDSPWTIRGAMMTGDAGSWVLSGTYVAEPTETHSLAVGLSYSRQHVHNGVNRNPLTQSAAVLEDANESDFSREVGVVNVQGTWNLSRWVEFDYGANVARYGYLPSEGFVSPNAVMTMEPLDRTRVRVRVAQNMLAPGAEEFLPPAAGVWLPPERTFALLSRTDSLQAERSQHFEVAIERDLGHASTIGVRRFHQDVDDQMVALFGVRPQIPVSSAADRYYLASASGVTTDGWGLMLRHTLGTRVTGTVDYSLTHSTWAPLAANGLSPRTAGVFRTGTEQAHDVTTSIETEIPETSTEVFLLYRVNSAFSVIDSATAAITSGLDGRFAMRVRQGLPFSPIEGSEWELLVDIRSLFREQVLGGSVYDELLVASPPKQIVGGLVVHF